MKDSIISAGARLKLALNKENPLKVVGTINAYTALMAEKAGCKAIYLSGAGVANASFGLPDLGMTTANDVAEDVRRITSIVDLPLLVDADTGWGNPHMVGRSIAMIEKAGAAGIHLEDQVPAKRCGHRPDKKIVSTSEMIERIKAAVDARKDDDFMIMARTDSYANEGLEQALERTQAYIDAGADAVFPEAMSTLDEYRAFTKAVHVPVLANITEFGKTPLFTAQELASVQVKMMLFPLTAFRMMSQAAGLAYSEIASNGTQKDLTDKMQTRTQLYEVLDYHRYENEQSKSHS